MLIAVGYFTSRATSKGWIREATAYLQAARQLEVLTQSQSSAKHPNTDSLEEAVSLLQHHDAITGTEKQHVTDDYHVRLARGEQLVLCLQQQPAHERMHCMNSMFGIAQRPRHSIICGLTPTISPNQLQDYFLELPAADMIESEQIDKGPTEAFLRLATLHWPMLIY